MNTEGPPEYYKLNELAAEWGVDAKTVAEWINYGAEREGQIIYLRTMNVNTSDKRPEYRIPKEWAQEFFQKALVYIPRGQRNTIDRKRRRKKTTKDEAIDGVLEELLEEEEGEDGPKTDT